MDTKTSKPKRGLEIKFTTVTFVVGVRGGEKVFAEVHDGDLEKATQLVVQEFEKRQVEQTRIITREVMQQGKSNLLTTNEHQ